MRISMKIPVMKEKCNMHMAAGERETEHMVV